MDRVSEQTSRRISIPYLGLDGSVTTHLRLRSCRVHDFTSGDRATKWSSFLPYRELAYRTKTGVAALLRSLRPARGKFRRLEMVVEVPAAGGSREEVGLRRNPRWRFAFIGQGDFRESQGLRLSQAGSSAEPG